MEYEDINRRLRILEGAIGINLDTAANCSGDPLKCPADPCNEDRCPMRNNLVQQMYRNYENLRQQLEIIQNLLEESFPNVINETMLSRAKRRIEKNTICSELALLKSILEEAKDTEDVKAIMKSRRRGLLDRLDMLNIMEGTD